MNIRLRPEVIFVENDNGLTVISPTKYKNLKANWVTPLHQKLFNLLLKGCSEKLLLDSVDKSRKAVVRSYINALKQCEALVSYGNYARKDDGDSLSGRSYEDHDDSSFFPVDGNLLRSGESIIENDDRNAVMCLTRYDSFLPLVNHLLNVKRYKRLIFVLTAIDESTIFSSPEIVNWLKLSLKLPSSENETLLIYSIDRNDGFNIKLKYKKSLGSFADLHEIFWKTGAIGQRLNISQIPLVSVRTGIEPFVRETVTGLNYGSVSGDLIVRETVRQMLFGEWKNEASERITDERLSNRFKNILTSASKTELCGKILETAGKHIFDESNSTKREIDGLTPDAEIPEIKYLQDILRTKFDSLPVVEENFGCFFRYERNGFSAVSFCRKKALFDLLLAIAGASFYPASSKDSDGSFYSGFAPFVNRRELKKLMKKCRRFLYSDGKINLPPVNRIETFWGDCFWTEFCPEGEKNGLK